MHLLLLLLMFLSLVSQRLFKPVRFSVVGAMLSRVRPRKAASRVMWLPVMFPAAVRRTLLIRQLQQLLCARILRATRHPVTVKLCCLHHRHWAVSFQQSSKKQSPHPR